MQCMTRLSICDCLHYTRDNFTLLNVKPPNRQQYIYIEDTHHLLWSYPAASPGHMRDTCLTVRSSAMMYLKYLHLSYLYMLFHKSISSPSSGDVNMPSAPSPK